MIVRGGHSRVSGLSHQEAGAGDQVQVRVQEICPLSSVIDSALRSFRVAGGGPGWQVARMIHSALHSVLHAVLNSVINSAPLCRDAVPTLPSAAEPRGGSG